MRKASLGICCCGDVVEPAHTDLVGRDHCTPWQYVWSAAARVTMETAA